MYPVGGPLPLPYSIALSLLDCPCLTQLPLPHLLPRCIASLCCPIVMPLPYLNTAGTSSSQTGFFLDNTLPSVNPLLTTYEEISKLGEENYSSKPVKHGRGRPRKIESIASEGRFFVQHIYMLNMIIPRNMAL